MTKGLKALLVLNALLLLCIVLGVTVHAQRPAATNADGTPFLPVNINPTEVPPMVNVNPNGEPAKVDVVGMGDIRLPDVKVTPSGCDSRENFHTAVGRSIAGPMVLTYLNLASQIQATLVSSGADNQRFTFSNAATLASAIYLRAGQQLTFDNDIMYSGCRPQ